MLYLGQIEHIFSGVFTMANRISTKQKLVSFTGNMAKSFRKKKKNKLWVTPNKSDVTHFYLFIYIFSTVYQQKYVYTKNVSIFSEFFFF